jgi:hypothetical protein
MARSVVPDGLPGVPRRFVAKACRLDVADMEFLDRQISLCRDQMAALETAILDRAPVSGREAVAKLKFMSALMLDGGDIATDYFAYLVEECAFALGDGQACDLT